MASSVIIPDKNHSFSSCSRLSPVSFKSNKVQRESITINAGLEIDNDAEEVLPGARLAEKLAFRNSRGTEISLTPVILEFRRLLQSKSDVEVVPGVCTRDLLHAVVGLYSTSLSEMTPDVLYSTVCEKWARTILLLRDVPDTVADLERRKEKKKEEAELEEEFKEESEDKKEPEKEKLVNGVNTDNEKGKEEEGEEESEDVLEAEEEKPDKFAEVFSDTDEEESEVEEEEEEDFSQGVNAFLQMVKERRESRNKHEGPLTAQHIGVENRLIGAATYKKTYCKGERVIHLTLLAVRKRLRRWGIGKYLLSQIKENNVVGSFDAVVVHADNAALDFFQRYGFTDDLVINNKWSELAEQFTNCTLMCYLPPFTGTSLASQAVPELDLIAMEKEINKWREKSMDAYKAEMGCMSRMRQEIIHLRALTSSQQEMMGTLLSENENLRREKFIIGSILLETKKEFLNYRFMTTKSAFGDDFGDDEDDDLSTEILIQQLKKQARISLSKSPSLPDDSERHFMMSTRRGSDEPYCHGRDTQDFYNLSQEFNDQFKKDSSVINTYEVKMITKAMLPASVEEAYKEQIKQTKDASLVARLYYCGSIQQSHRLQQIISNGFSQEDFSDGDYGRGLYFTKFPSKAAHFSTFGKMLVAEVGLGDVESVVKKDKSRQKPSDGHDSILTCGRLAEPDGGDSENELCEEYVIFNPHQARPLYLLEYSPITISQ